MLTRHLPRTEVICKISGGVKRKAGQCGHKMCRKLTQTEKPGLRRANPGEHQPQTRQNGKP
eukprot:805277-Amphidinium_carterae.1